MKKIITFALASLMVLSLSYDIQAQDKKAEKKARETMSDEEAETTDKEIDDLVFKKTELFNMRQTIDTSKEKARYKAVGEEIKALEKQIDELKKKKAAVIAEHKKAMKQDTAYLAAYDKKMADITAQFEKLNESLEKQGTFVGDFNIKKLF